MISLRCNPNDVVFDLSLYAELRHKRCGHFDVRPTANFSGQLQCKHLRQGWRYHKQGRNQLAAHVAANAETVNSLTLESRGFDGRLALAVSVVNDGTQSAQGIYQYSDGPLLHPGRSRKGFPHPGYREIGRKKTHGGTGILDVDQWRFRAN